MTRKNERPSMSELSPRRPSPKAAPKRVVDARTPPDKPQVVEKNLMESLASTDAGLKTFLASLKQARMPEAVQAYRAMQMVLVQQRLWVDANKRDHLQPHFESIAQTAGEIHAIFSSFADVMRPLKELDKLGAPEIAKPNEEPKAPEGGQPPP